MKLLIPITMNFLTSLLTALFCLTQAGCAPGNIGEAPEFNTPTGCRMKKEGRYYDPKVGECVKPTSIYETSVLKAYRRLYEEAESGKYAAIEYAIYPRRPLTKDEAEALWSELRQQGAKMLHLGASMPDNREYDNLPGHGSDLLQYQDDPKTWWVNAIVHSGVAWTSQEHPNSTATTVEAMMLETIETIEQERPHPQLRKAILEDEDYRITSIRVIAEPKMMPDWVNRHMDVLVGARPIVDELDKLATAIGPIEGRREGE